MSCPPPEGPAHSVIHDDTKRNSLAFVSAAHSRSYARDAMAAAVRSVVEHLHSPLSSLVRSGDRVLVKVNMGCSGFRNPEERVTSHPAYVEAIIECLLDCGAHVTFGDDVARAVQYNYILRLLESSGYPYLSDRIPFGRLRMTKGDETSAPDLDA